MAANDLTALSHVKEWLGLTTNSDDALLSRMITALSTYIESYLSRDILATSYSEVYDGKGGNTMLLRNYPITAVASVSIGGVVIPVSSGPTASGFTFNRTILYLTGYSFNRGIQNVAVSYTAGYSSVPADLEQACIDLISEKYRNRQRIGEVSKNLAGQVVAFSQKDMSDNIKTILQQYVRTVPL